MVHVVPVINDEVYHAAPQPSESLGFYDRMDDYQEQFNEMQKEMKAITRKDLFRQNASHLCLVPNVKVLVKFKVPEFEKYKGKSCPRDHLVMYIRRMSIQHDDQCVLIHFFQDSLIGAT